MMPEPPRAVNDTPALPAVDTHFHVFPAGVARVAGARYVPAYDATLADWSRAAGAVGLRAGVLVQTSFLGTDNDALLAALASDPARLRAVVSLDPQVPDATLAALHAAGARGIRFNLAGRAPCPSAAEQALAARVAAAGWHVELHADRGAMPAALDAIPAGVPVVVDHFGKPAGPEEPALWRAVARRSPLPWVKLSAPYRLGDVAPQALAARWRDAVGGDALLWGSDWPCTNHEAQRPRAFDWRRLRDWLGDDADVDRVLRSNPARLYGFAPGA